jgi:xanthine dehydrogenase accessory factor
MIDRRRIVRQWRQGLGKVLVTLVRVEGSSYRRPGAHMLIESNGQSVGTISGGCLESEVIRKAAWSVRNGPVIERYSTLFDDTADIPYGLGCGGVVDLLLEPVESPECQALLAAMEASLNDLEFGVATWLPHDDQPLARVVLRSTGEVVFASRHLSPSELKAAQNLLSRTDPAEPEQHDSADPDRLCFQRLAPPQRLLVLGAGDDARPVVTLASLLGWTVVVADGRSQLARAERFPEATQVMVGTDLHALTPRASDAVVLMSHSYEQDRTSLQHLLSGLSSNDPSRVPGYVGLLGARHRSALLISETAAALGLEVAACCEKVWAPVGLDLGGDGPEAVALSVIAEIQSWVQGRLARSRRLSADDVAIQVAKGGASAYLQAHCAVELSPR